MLFEFELVILLAIIGTMLLCHLVFKLPLSIATLLAAMVGMLTGGGSISLRHLFEGCFAMIDMAMLMFCALIYMNVVSRVGIFKAVGSAIAGKFYRRPVLMVLILMLMLLFPGMITGSANVAVLSAGPIIFPILLLLGMSAAEAGAFLAVGAMLSLAAPPVNIPAMMIAYNVDMSYMGFTGPLLFITFISALFSALFLCRKYFKPLQLEVLREKIDLEAGREYGWKLYIPILFVVVIIVAIRAFPQFVPDIGTPLILFLGAIVGCFAGKRCNLIFAIRDAVGTGVSIVAKMMAIGMVIQVFSLMGIRGYIVANAMLLPAALLLGAVCIIMPLFGGISVYGSSMLISGAVILSMLTSNQIVIACALSVLAGMGELMPPAALTANYAAGIVGVDYKSLVRFCAVPIGFILVFCYLVMTFSNRLAFLTRI